VILAFRHSQAAGWSTLPLFLFWAALMTCIWLYLLGISSFLSGHFSTLEIAMAVVVEIASSFGIAMFVPGRKTRTAGGLAGAGPDSLFAAGGNPP